MTSNSELTGTQDSLGAVIHRARVEAGLTFSALAQASGVAQGQLSKLEKNQVKKVNPAHLAAIAEPLGLSLYALYSAAGYKTPASLSHLGDELEAKLSRLPPQALKRLDAYVNRLAKEQQLAVDPVIDLEPSGDA